MDSPWVFLDTVQIHRARQVPLPWVFPLFRCRRVRTHPRHQASRSQRTSVCPCFLREWLQKRGSLSERQPFLQGVSRSFFCVSATIGSAVPYHFQGCVRRANYRVRLPPTTSTKKTRPPCINRLESKSRNILSPLSHKVDGKMPEKIKGWRDGNLPLVLKFTKVWTIFRS